MGKGNGQLINGHGSARCERSEHRFSWETRAYDLKSIEGGDNTVVLMIGRFEMIDVTGKGVLILSP